MYCRKCGTKLSDGAKFCWHCGAQVVTINIDQAGNKAAKPEQPGSEEKPIAPELVHTEETEAVQASEVQSEEQVTAPLILETKTEETVQTEQPVVDFKQKDSSNLWKKLFVILVIVLAAVLILGFCYIKFFQKNSNSAPSQKTEEELVEKAGKAEKGKSAKSDSGSEKKEKDQKEGKKPEPEPSQLPATQAGDQTLDQAMADPNGFLLPNAATTALTDADLEKFTPQQLTYARNEIYARHGAIFQSSELNQYFQTKSWYQGTTPAANVTLSGMELQNASMILDYQKTHNSTYSPKN
ncbi:YARHG domain-containing protein [Lachnospiraceae bacterium YH-ros2228]